MPREDFHADDQCVNQVAARNTLALRCRLDTLHLPKEIKVNRAWRADNRNVREVTTGSTLFVHTIVGIRSTEEDN